MLSRQIPYQDRVQDALRGAPPLMDAAELSRYSLRNVLLYLADPSAHAKAASLELSVTSRARQAEATRHQEKGVFVPFAVFARDLVVGTPGAGGDLVGTAVERDKIIDLLRPASAAIAAGAQVLTGLTSNLAIPRLTGGTPIQWVAENTAPTEGAPSWDQVALSPKTAAGYVDIGRRLLLQTGGDAQSLVVSDLLSGVATAIDYAALMGTGTGNQRHTLAPHAD